MTRISILRLKPKIVCRSVDTQSLRKTRISILRLKHTQRKPGTGRGALNYERQESQFWDWNLWTKRKDMLVPIVYYERQESQFWDWNRQQAQPVRLDPADLRKTRISILRLKHTQRKAGSRAWGFELRKTRISILRLKPLDKAQGYVSANRILRKTRISILRLKQTTGAPVRLDPADLRKTRISILRLKLLTVFGILCVIWATKDKNLNSEIENTGIPCLAQKRNSGLRKTRISILRLKRGGRYPPLPVLSSTKDKNLNSEIETVPGRTKYPVSIALRKTRISILRLKPHDGGTPQIIGDCYERQESQFWDWNTDTGADVLVNPVPTKDKNLNSEIETGDVAVLLRGLQGLTTKDKNLNSEIETSKNVISFRVSPWLRKTRISILRIETVKTKNQRSPDSFSTKDKNLNSEIETYIRYFTIGNRFYYERQESQFWDWNVKMRRMWIYVQRLLRKTRISILRLKPPPGLSTRACWHFIATRQSRETHRRMTPRRGWVSQPVVHTSETMSGFCRSIFQNRRFSVEIWISTYNLQLIQPVWFGVPNPRWSMGEGTSPLRLQTVLQMSTRPKAHVKRKCKTRIEIVGAGSPRPQSVRVGVPNPYEDSVAVARFLNMNPD